MFENVGSKLKGFAIAEFVICIILIVIFTITTWVNGEFLIGLLIAAAGFLTAWVNSLLLYGVGVAAQSAEQSAYYAEQAARKVVSSPAAQGAKGSVSSSTGPVGWKCKQCGTQNSSLEIHCKKCGNNH